MFWLCRREEMRFQIIGKIRDVKPATRFKIRVRKSLQEEYGKGRWKKLKGIAKVRFEDGVMCLVELHWYEAHGIGKRKIRVKYVLEYL